MRFGYSSQFLHPYITGPGRTAKHPRLRSGRYRSLRYAAVWRTARRHERWPKYLHPFGLSGASVAGAFTSYTSASWDNPRPPQPAVTARHPCYRAGAASLTFCHRTGDSSASRVEQETSHPAAPIIPVAQNGAARCGRSGPTSSAGRGGSVVKVRFTLREPARGRIP